jgi:hypothetical protein
MTLVTRPLRASGSARRDSRLVGEAELALEGKDGRSVDQHTTENCDVAVRVRVSPSENRLLAGGFPCHVSAAHADRSGQAGAATSAAAYRVDVKPSTLRGAGPEPGRPDGVRARLRQRARSGVRTPGSGSVSRSCRRRRRGESRAASLHGRSGLWCRGDGRTAPCDERRAARARRRRGTTADGLGSRRSSAERAARGSSYQPGSWTRPRPPRARRPCPPRVPPGAA